AVDWSRRPSAATTVDRSSPVHAATFSVPGAVLTPSNESHAMTMSTRHSASVRRYSRGKAATRATAGLRPSTSSASVTSPPPHGDGGGSWPWRRTLVLSRRPRFDLPRPRGRPAARSRSRDLQRRGGVGAEHPQQRGGRDSDPLPDAHGGDVSPV